MDNTDRDPQMSARTEGKSIVLRLTEDEREVLELALGELLSSARRDEHLIPTVQGLLDNVRAAGPTHAGDEASR
jgi:hypothetical protein